MIRPAEIRALYSKLKEGGPHPEGDPRQILAEALKSEMGRMWEVAVIYARELTAVVGSGGGGDISIHVFWKKIEIFEWTGGEIIMVDSRFGIQRERDRLFVARFLADDWPELVVHPPA